MKLLIDESLSARVAVLLVEVGHDAIHVGDLNLLGAPDTAVMDAARRDRRCVVSVDTDFGAKSRGGGVYNHSTNLSPREQETRRLGMVEFKDILQYGHTDLALKYMAPGYMQHNVNVPGGRDNFVKNFSNREKIPLADAWRTPPTLELVTGNFYLKFDQRMEGPEGRQTAYYRFDMVRVDDGLIQEHWDVAFPNGIQR